MKTFLIVRLKHKIIYTSKFEQYAYCSPELSSDYINFRYAYVYYATINART